MTDKEKTAFKNLFEGPLALPLDKTWNEFFNPNHYRQPAQKARMDWMTTHLRGPNVIDIGCGVGLACVLSAHYAMVNYVLGVDISQPALMQARDNLVDQPELIREKIQWSQDFAEELTWVTEGTFDTVLLTEVLAEVHDPEEVVNEARRVMMADGVLLACVSKGGHVEGVQRRTFNWETFLGLLHTKFEVLERKDIYEWMAVVCYSKVF